MGREENGVNNQRLIWTTLKLHQYNANYDNNGGEEVDENSFFIEFFAAEFGPDEGQNDAHKEDNNGLGGVGGNRSEGDGGGESKGDAVRKGFNGV